MKKVSKIAFVALATIIMILTGCRSAKDATGAITATRHLSLNDLYTALTEQYSTWSDLNIPMKVSLNSPQKISVSGRAYMTRNKSLMLSLRVLGMEVMSMYITNDSIFATDKMHKYYLAESLSQITNEYPITVNDIQDLLLGKAFIIEKGTLDKSMKKLVKLSEISANYWAIEPKKAFGDFSYAFAANNASQITALAINKGEQSVVGCDYSEQKQSPSGTVAEVINITLNHSKQPIQAAIKWDFNGAKWNSGSERTWKKPNGYTRITTEQLIKAFMPQ